MIGPKADVILIVAMCGPQINALSMVVGDFGPTLPLPPIIFARSIRSVVLLIFLLLLLENCANLADKLLPPSPHTDDMSDRTSSRVSMWRVCQLASLDIVQKEINAKTLIFTLDRSQTPNGVWLSANEPIELATQP